MNARQNSKPLKKKVLNVMNDLKNIQRIACKDLQKANCRFLAKNQRIKPENIYPTEARKANGQGQVTINVKQSAFLQKEKKPAAFASSTRKNQEKPCRRDENLWRK